MQRSPRRGGNIVRTMTMDGAQVSAVPYCGTRDRRHSDKTEHHAFGKRNSVCVMMKWGVMETYSCGVDLVQHKEAACARYWLKIQDSVLSVARGEQHFVRGQLRKRASLHAKSKEREGSSADPPCIMPLQDHPCGTNS